MAKVHLAQTEEPLRFGESVDVLTVCDCLIPDAQILAVWDSQAMQMNVEQPISIGTCKKCFELIQQQNSECRYVYGISERKEKE